VPLHQVESVLKRRVRSDHQRVHDHSGFELLDPADLFGLLVHGQIAMDDADAAGLRHGDGQTPFGDRVHGTGKQGKVEFDAPGDAGPQVGLGREHFGVPGHQEHIVECERFRTMNRLVEFGHVPIPFQEIPPGRRKQEEPGTKRHE
jgi:hypothetical protein